MSDRNFALKANDIFGSRLINSRHRQFNRLAFVNAATTARVLPLIPLLPRNLLNRKKGDPSQVS